VAQIIRALALLSPLPAKRGKGWEE
jgi:hypothetical protein